MGAFQVELVVQAPRRGLFEITDQIEAELKRVRDLECGIVSVFCRHTSCSLLLMENADPSARRDLEDWLDRLVPAGDPRFTHTQEGPDDMPSHIKMALTRSSEQIPFARGRLDLGTWQGVFLWEHRDRPPRRRLTLTGLY